MTREIHRISGQGSFGRDFALRDQIRRASVSVMSNIAEGFERSGTAEFIQFLSQAKGSAGEVRSLLHVALDQTYVEPDVFERLARLSRQTARQIAGLMLYLRRCGTKGWKFERNLQPRNL